MPYLKIETNIKLDYDRREMVMASCSRLLSQHLEKPQQYVMVALRGGVDMLFAGTTDPCAYLELKSLGLVPERLPPLSATLCQHLNEQTGLDPSRIYIEFSAPERSHWGWNNTTFGS